MPDSLYRRAIREIAEAALDADSPGVAWARIMGLLQSVVGFDSGFIGTCGGTTETSHAVLLGHEEAVFGRSIGRYLAELSPREIAQYVTRTQCSSAVFSTRRREELSVQYPALAPSAAKHMIHRVDWARGELFGFNLERGRHTSEFGEPELQFMDGIFPLLQVVNLLGKGEARNHLDVMAQWSLTRREADVVQLVIRGLQNSEIAQVLGLSRNTVRNVLARVFEKARVSTRSELVYLAHRLQVRITAPLSVADTKELFIFANKVRDVSVGGIVPAMSAASERAGAPKVHHLVPNPAFRQF